MDWQRPLLQTKITALSTWILALVIKAHSIEPNGKQSLVTTMTTFQTSLKHALRSESLTVSYLVVRITILTRSILPKCSPIRRNHRRKLWQRIFKSYPPLRLWMIRSSVLTLTLLWEPLEIIYMSSMVIWTFCMSIASKISNGISVASLTWESSDDK